MPENIAITVDDTTETVSLVVTSGTVDSVFGRTGAVVAVAGDYDTSEVTEVTNLYYTEARVAANSAVALNTAKVTFPEAPNDGTQYARKSLGWEAVASGGDYADGGEAGGADRTLGNTDNFSLGFLVNNLKALLLKPVVSAVNWLAISPSTTGNDVIISAEGTDTNIDIAITPKGSGAVLSNGDVVVSGGSVTSATVATTTVSNTSLNTSLNLYGGGTNGLGGRIVLEGRGQGLGVTIGNVTTGISIALSDIIIMGTGAFPTGNGNGGDVAIDGGAKDGTGTDGNVVIGGTRGNLGVGVAAPITKAHINGAITQNELSADPADPAEGSTVQWMSDGTGSGDDGDIMVKITAGGVTKTATLLDFSTL